MTLGEALGLSDATERRVARGLQLLLVGLLGFGLVTVQADLIVTTGIALGVTLLPALLRREYDYSMDAGLVLWIAVAMVLHVLGSMGIYEQFQWYDEVTHTVSATLVAGIGYASFRAVECHSEAVDVPPVFRTVFIVVFVLAAGILWEVIEFGLGGLVTVYGIDDIVTDLVFNGVGALVVAIWGTGYVGDLVGFIGDRIR